MRIMNEERPHISISQLTTYLQCPRQYYYQYVQAIPWATTPPAVAFGDVAHKAIEVINRSLIDGSKVIDREESISVFTQAWTAKSASDTESIDWKTPDESADLLVKGMELIGLYHDRFNDSKIRDVELEFRLPILDANTGLFIESHDVVGKIDAISIDGNIIEIKTASKSPCQTDIDTNMQLTLYSWAYRLLYGQPEDKLMVVSLVKTKDPQIVCLNTTRTEVNYSRLFKLIDSILKAIDSGLFYCNQLNVWGCKSCQYVTQCESE
jgi:CRISPR/Cas system-associated exonuclease Cas4 (RecB family)